MKFLLRWLLFSFLICMQIFPQGYKLIWSDEFNTTALDLSKWSYEAGNGSNGWGNKELEYYTNRTQNVTVNDSALAITALKENYSGYGYTSGRIKTQDKFSFRYGKIEARIKLPYGRGIWPAFWMLGDNINTVGWPACGENDIMEMVGGQGKNGTTILSDSTIYGTAHWSSNGQHASYGKSYTLPSGRFADGYHIFSVTWDKSKIVWYVDGIEYNRLDITPAGLSAFQNKFFIILNLAVGGNWPGNPDGTTAFPQTMKVDYIRVYQDTTALPSVSIISPQNNSSFAAGTDIILTANAAIQGGNISKVEFYQGAEKIGETFLSPYMMTWKNVLPGNYKITAGAYSNTGTNLVSDTINISVGNNADTSPYGGTPSQIPGTIEAENYDLGGQGKAYNDTDPQNLGGQYRPFEAVDIETCSDTGNGFDVGWTQNGEWLLYTINVSDGGAYRIGVRVSSGSAGGSLHFEIDDADVTGTISVPGTSGWQNWTTVTSNNLNLSAGIHKLKLFINSLGFNINKIEIYPPGAQPSINLIYPSGGEVFIADSIAEIKWKSQLVDQVMIGYSTNGGSSWLLAQDKVDAKFGIYRWKIPSVSSSNCMIQVVDKNNFSILGITQSPFTIGIINSVSGEQKLPAQYSLFQNYPNPFNPSTEINYQIPKESFVSIKVYDVTGREVADLVNRQQQTGNYNITFNANKLSSGIYFYHIVAGNYSAVRKMLLLK